MLNQLKSIGISAWYWRSDANAEIDFLTDEQSMLLPIEVKSADNTKAKSLRLFCDRYHPPKAVKTSLKNLGLSRQGDTEIWSLPLYALFRLKDVLRYSE